MEHDCLSALNERLAKRGVPEINVELDGAFKLSVIQIMLLIQIAEAVESTVMWTPMEVPTNG